MDIIKQIKEISKNDRLFLIDGKEKLIADSVIGKIMQVNQIPSDDPFNRIVIEAEEFDIDLFRDLLERYPFGKESKIIHIRGIDFSDNSFSRFDSMPDVLKKTKLDHTVLIIETRKTDKRKTLYKTLISMGKLFETKKLEGSILSNWIQKEFSVLNKAISSSLADKIAIMSGYSEEEDLNLYYLRNEIQKIALLNESTSEIKESVINELLGNTLKENAFKFSKFLLDGENTRFYESIKKLINEGQDMFKLLGLISWQFRHFYYIKTLHIAFPSSKEINSKLKMHPYAFNENQRLVKDASLEYILSILQKLKSVEFDAKTGRCRLEEGILKLAQNKKG